MQIYLEETYTGDPCDATDSPSTHEPDVTTFSDPGEPEATLATWEIGLIAAGCVGGVAFAGGLVLYINKRRNNRFDRLRSSSE